MTLFLMKTVSGTALILLASVVALVFDGVDRIVHARMQNRLGPPVFQPFYDLLKLMGKENIVPRAALAWLFNGAPWVACVSAMMIFLYIPVGSLPPILGGEGDLVLILYLFALSAVAMVVGGFASASPYANVGAQREMVLMMSYEAPLAMVICTLAWIAYRTGMPGEPFNLESFVGISVWQMVGKTGFLGLLVLLGTLLAVVPAEVGKSPMDIPEAKTEILEGLIAEYSGRNLALLKITFAVRTLAMCGVVVSLFFPWSLARFLGMSSVVAFAVDFLWFWIKVFLVQMVSVTLVRTSLGRLKIWQASKFYWVQVSGLALAGMLLVSLDTLV